MTMWIPKKEKSLLTTFLWVVVSEAIIIIYAFCVVPSNADVNLHAFFLLGQPFPKDIFYLLPVLLLLGIVIIVIGNSKISMWLVGVIILYLGVLASIECGSVRANAFGFWLDLLGGVGIVTIPFWCLFLFLWELLFCGIAKLLRRTQDKNAG